MKFEFRVLRSGIHSRFRSPEEAGAYVKSLQAILRAVGSSDGNMEQVEHTSNYKLNCCVDIYIGIL